MSGKKNYLVIYTKTEVLGRFAHLDSLHDLSDIDDASLAKIFREAVSKEKGIATISALSELLDIMYAA